MRGEKVRTDGSDEGAQEKTKKNSFGQKIKEKLDDMFD